jgi:hypothetical protein
MPVVQRHDHYQEKEDDHNDGGHKPSEQRSFGALGGFVHSFDEHSRRCKGACSVLLSTGWTNQGQRRDVRCALVLHCVNQKELDPRNYTFEGFFFRQFDLFAQALSRFLYCFLCDTQRVGHFPVV